MLTTTIPRIPTIELPSGLRLQRGEYPREVQWFDGELSFTHDLLTGNRQVQFLDEPYIGNPQDSFRVIATSRDAPSLQRIDLGVVDVLISQQGIDFVRSESEEQPFQRGRNPARAFGRQRRSRF